MKYKKAFMSLGSTLMILSPIASVVSCGNNFGPDYRYYGDIQVITDAGSIQDKSFNESSFLAIRDFAELETDSKRPTTFGFSQPEETTTGLIQKAYLSALKAGSKYLVLPGFTHSETSEGNVINFALKHRSQYSNVRYINADGSSSGTANEFWTQWLAKKIKDTVWAPYVAKSNGKFLDSKGNEFPNIKDLEDACKQNGLTPQWTPNADEAAANKLAGYYSLSYNSYESGYLTAIYGGGFFNEEKKVNAPIKAATFGGLAIPFGVTSFMDGYLQGIYWFNKNAGYQPPTNPGALWTAGSSVKKRKSDGKPYQQIKPVFLGGDKASKADFTGSFDAGGATSKALTLIDQKKAQMILPVAGPQTGDVVGIIKSKAKKGEVYAFGVDTDQSLVYDSSIILGSAVKGIYASTSFALKTLTDNPDADSFPSFGLRLKSPKTSNPAFRNYIYGVGGTENSPKSGSLLSKLYADAKGDPAKERASRIKVLPTGFAPSFTASKDPESLENIIAEQLLGSSIKTWEDIEDFAGGVNGVADDYPSATPVPGLSQETADIYGSFYRIATS